MVNVVDVEEVKMKRRKEEEEPAPAEMLGEELEGGGVKWVLNPPLPPRVWPTKQLIGPPNNCATCNSPRAGFHTKPIISISMGRKREEVEDKCKNKRKPIY